MADDSSISSTPNAVDMGSRRLTGGRLAEKTELVVGQGVGESWARPLEQELRCGCPFDQEIEVRIIEGYQLNQRGTALYD